MDVQQERLDVSILHQNRNFTAFINQPETKLYSPLASTLKAKEYDDDEDGERVYVTFCKRVC